MGEIEGHVCWFPENPDDQSVGFFTGQGFKSVASLAEMVQT